MSLQLEPIPAVTNRSGSQGGGEGDQASGQARDSDAKGAVMSDLITTPIVDNDGFNDEIPLAMHAEAIRVLGRRVIGDVIEIGRRLTISKELCGHGDWLPWLKREFGWSDDSALRFMQVAEFAKNRNLRNLEIPVSGLYLLAAPSTPEAARDEAIERSEAGERLTPAQIKETIDKAIKAELDTELETMRATYERREATIRAEYEGRAYLTPAQQQAKIDKVMAPLRKQIEKYQEKLAKIKEREDASARNALHPSRVADNGAEPPRVQKESRSPADAVESYPEKGPNSPGDQAETRSTKNSAERKDEVDSPSIAPAEVSGPQELDRGVSAADVADKEALCAVEAVWRRASARAHKRIVAFVTSEMKATVEAKHRREAGEPRGGPDVKPVK
jgi:ribosome-associated translation inhibitor RaiA